MTPRRALVCSYSPPEFDRDSGSKRILDAVSCLREDGWAVTFVASHHLTERRYQRALQQMGVAVFDGGKIQMEAWLQTMQPHLALLAYWPVAEIYLPLIRRYSPSTKVIVDSVDLHFLRESRRQLHASAADLRTRSLDNRYGTEFVREVNVYAAADAVLTVSAKEATLVHDLVASAGLAHAVPDSESLPARQGALRSRRGILLVGSYRHEPNVAAVKWLCQEILPRLDRALLKQHPVWIVGDGLDSRLRGIGEGLSSVRMVGWVPSIAPYAARARLSIIPLRWGAGTKRKLLQAAMAGLPIVSTSIGVEGFDLRHGEDILIADDADGFAKEITRLLEDDRLWRKLSQRARKRLSTRHSAAAVRQSLKEVLDHVLAAPLRHETLTPGPKTKGHVERLDKRAYQQLQEAIRGFIDKTVPLDRKVVVVSRGDEELLKLGRRIAWHYPQTPQGTYAGYHPADDSEAISQLITLQDKGAQYILFPATALWWLDHYDELKKHLSQNHRLVAEDPQVGVVYQLLGAEGEPSVPAPKPHAQAIESTPSPNQVTASENDVRLIAFYLPQFHPIPENDRWWGQGFTEWTNVSKARPLFPDHYQPHIPSELGAYDLRDPRVRERQAGLAQEYGIHGFCYYHYWFHGTRLLEQPFNEVLASGAPAFPFCLCWANESWSRRWDGQPGATLQPQTYSPGDDLAHIRWLLPALSDARAIRIKGKPVFLIYRGRELPSAERTIETWRREVDREGLPGLYLLAVESGWDAGWNATAVGFDAKVLFQPQFTQLLNSNTELSQPGDGRPRVFDYARASRVLSQVPDISYPHFETVFPTWDNSPRTGANGVVLHKSNPVAYESWLREAIRRAGSRPCGQRVVFLNAWNEWGEGCHLEPDERFGRGFLDATRRALIPLASTRAPSPKELVAIEPVSIVEGDTEETEAESYEKKARDGGVIDEAYRQMLDAAQGKASDEQVAFEETKPAPPFPGVKLVAFYLPQFHEIPENNEWWGKGFTEWTNVSKAVPQFVGHYQPHLPGELGFYDLRLPEVQRRQVELAKRFGIHAFCFYYYWFAGKTLLEHPIKQFLGDKEIDFPFCLCWANENWTRRWDGQEDQVLIAQDHTAESDLDFIKSITPILRHRNYLRIQGRPVIIVYRVNLLPEPAATAGRWREYAARHGLENPYLIAAEVFERVDPRILGFDATVEFPPNTPGTRKEITPQISPLNKEYSGEVFPYEDMIRRTIERPAPDYELFRSVCPSWDNEARRPGRGSTYAFSTPQAYAGWLQKACQTAIRDPEPSKRLVFVNAWNEWGEGAHLEPDRRYGYAYLQSTADVLRSFPLADGGNQGDWTILFVSHDAHRGGAQLVLLNLIQWLKQHTRIRMKIVCLSSGDWLSRFRDLSDTVVMPVGDNQSSATDPDADLRKLREFCGRAPDLIYANSVASGRAYSLLRRLGAPILTHVHELPSSMERYAGPWLKDIVEDSKHFIACAPVVRDSLHKRLAVEKSRISVVHASILPRSEASDLSVDDRVAFRRKLDLPTSGLLAMGCGVGMPFRKGADFFIDVAREVARQGFDDIHFRWIGEFDQRERDAQGETWSDHLARLYGEGLANIRFLGTQDDPVSFLRAANIFLLTSREDPFPLVALEAAESGLPVLCFADSGGMPRFVGRDAGCIVAKGDVKAMASRVIALYRDRERRERLGRNARQKLLSRFTTHVTSPHILSVCRTTAGKNPRVSVIVPNYNHERYLTRRLDSIFEQTYRDFEVILLDDASTDNSLEILERYRERADVRLLRNRRNSGSTFRQWLKGLAQAKGDIIWIAESDDCCEPEFLERLLPAFDDPEVKLSYANSHVIDRDDQIVGHYTNTDYLTSLCPRKWTEDYCVTAEKEINAGLGVKNTILSASSVLFRRFSLDGNAERTLKSLRLTGDWFFFIHAIFRGKVHYSSQRLNHHRRHSDSVIGKLLKQNRVKDFFRESSVVHDTIFKRYRLDEVFVGKWEHYLQTQWASFHPDGPVGDLEQVYPLQSLRDELQRSISGAIENTNRMA